MTDSTSVPEKDKRPFFYMHGHYFDLPPIQMLTNRAQVVHLELIATYCDRSRDRPEVLTAEDLAPHPTRVLNQLRKQGLLFEDSRTPGEHHLAQWVWDVEIFRRGPHAKQRQAIPTEVRRAVYERDGYQCLHCGTTENLSLDHIHPWSLGGSDDPENLQTLCRPCNSRKGARVVQ